MKVFGIYEKIDGVDMIDTFNAFYECVSIYAAVKLFIKNAKTECGIYDTENFEVVEIPKRLQNQFKKNHTYLKTILNYLGNTTYYLIHGQSYI